MAPSDASACRELGERPCHLDPRRPAPDDDHIEDGVEGMLVVACRAGQLLEVEPEPFGVRDRVQGERVLGRSWYAEVLGPPPSGDDEV